METASVLCCVGPRPALQAYATTWHLHPPAGSRAPVAGGTVPAWQMGMCERNLVRRIPCRHLLGLKPGFDKKYLLKKEKVGQENNSHF